MKYFISILIFSVSLSVQAAESLSSKEDAQLLAEAVMESVSKDKLKDGLEKLRPYTVVPVAEFDVQMGQMDMKIPAIAQRFGKSIGYDFVEEEQLGESLIQYVYLQKFEKHVMVWRFIFYKPKDKWLLNTWYFNDQIQLLFKH
ncbi:hypothetical protein [uncultured Shewanella sp.]|uniref:hypothetical protein n=1 Tax=Shewanella atlantica TaxID=271099 RepID=UPI002619D0B6|nr:hypothetical protein [uncultured Shewanella sp.]